VNRIIDDNSRDKTILVRLNTSMLRRFNRFILHVI
jgi:hypothetical protein